MTHHPDYVDPLIPAAGSILKAAVNNVHDADIMTDDWTYYVYILLTLLPAYLFFKLWMWMGWQLYVNN